MSPWKLWMCDHRCAVCYDEVTLETGPVNPDTVSRGCHPGDYEHVPQRQGLAGGVTLETVDMPPQEKIW